VSKRGATTTLPAADSVPAGPAPGSPAAELASKPGLRIRPYRPMRALVGAFMVVAAVLAGFALYTRISDRVEVVALARDVLAGQQVTEADLRVTSINAGGDQPSVPASQRDTVVGQYARYRLGSETVLDPKSVQAEPLVTPGRGRLSVVVPAGEVPDGLREQSRVALFAYARSGSGIVLAAVVEATVVAVPRDLATLIGSADSSEANVPLSVDIDPEDGAVVRAADFVGVMLLDADEPVPEMQVLIPVQAQAAPGASQNAAADPLYGPTTVPSNASTTVATGPQPDGATG
jgi:hypothetical protein